MRLDLVVARRGVDPAATTCEHALQTLLRLNVERVERALLWRFEAASESARELRPALVRAAMRAGRYVNSNRDRCTWADEEAAPDAAGCVADVWVCDDDGRDLAALAYFREQVGAGVQELRRGVRWRLFLASRVPEAARELVQEITTTRSRWQGLLHNPQSQSAEILRVLGPASGEKR